MTEQLLAVRARVDTSIRPSRNLEGFVPQVRKNLKVGIVVIRVLTQNGPKDIEIIDWGRTEAMLSGVSVMDLCVPEDPFCSATVVTDNKKHYAWLREGVQRVMHRYEWKIDDDWAARHFD